MRQPAHGGAASRAAMRDCGGSGSLLGQRDMIVEGFVRLIPSVIALSLASTAAGAATLNCAQVRLIVPYAAGGATDVAARLIAERLEPALKKTVLVETRTGASGNIGTVFVVQSPPDGCTLLINGNNMAVYPYSFNKLGYDPLKDLAPIGAIGVTPTLLVTATANKVTDMKGLVSWSKEQGGLNFSTAGTGLLQHLAMEEFGQRSGAKVQHVPYKGGAQAVSDLVAARVDFGSFAAGSVTSFVQGNQLKVLAVVQETRSVLYPNVPTSAEQGFPGLDAGVHFLLFAPAATPKEIVSMLSEELRKIVGDPALKERFEKIAFEPKPTTPEETAAIMRKTDEVWGPVIRRLGIKMD
jgi:tripartite-type tricarboxylate transporter receptor subunit TctC